MRRILRLPGATAVCGTVLLLSLCAAPVGLAMGTEEPDASASTTERSEPDPKLAANVRDIWIAPVPPVESNDAPAANDAAHGEQGVDGDQQPEAAKLAPIKRPSSSARPLGPRNEGKPGSARASDGPGSSGEPGTALGLSAARPLGDQNLRKEEVSRTALALGGVIATILAIAAALKRFGRGSLSGRGWSLAALLGPAGRAPSGVMRVLARYPVARGQSLVLLQIDRRVLVLSHTSPSFRLRGGLGGFTTLAEITDPEEVASLIVKTGASSEAARGAGFDSAMARHSAVIDRCDSRVEDEQVSDRAREGGELRIVRETEGGDRAELWNDHAVLRPSSDGRAWIASGDAGASNRNGTLAVTEPSGDAMASIRHRLAGLKGRGVLG